MAGKAKVEGAIFFLIELSLGDHGGTKDMAKAKAWVEELAKLKSVKLEHYRKRLER